MKLGNYEAAEKELKKFKHTDDPNINGLAYMNLGDALSEQGKNDDALVFYKKAADTNSEVFQSEFLYRYGLALINVEDYSGAKTTFDRLIKEYPNSSYTKNAENYLEGL